MIKTNLTKRYKDNNPKETIQNIKNFFESRNFSVKIDELKSVEDSSNIFRCVLELYYNNIKINSAYGKGTTEEFCLASGYAELYERFCNYSPYIFNARLLKIKQDLNYKTKGYYLDPDEKQLTFDELLPDDNIKNNFNKMFSNSENFLKLVLDNKFIGIPFKSIFNEETKYYNPRVLVSFGSTNGMSAGNTIEEALVQGISELFERKIIEEFTYNLGDTYYYINNNILSDTIKKVISDLEKHNKEVKVFDLSYNFNIPIVMIAIRDLISNSIAVNFASNPVFDIAVERTLTEVYQQLTKLECPEYFKQNLQYLNDSFKSKDTLRYIVSHPLCNINIIPESLFISAQQKETFNKKCFLPASTYANTELLVFIKTICKENNIGIFYHDNSLCDTMKAIHIYSPELSVKIMPITAINTDTIITDTSKLFNYETYATYNSILGSTKLVSPESVDPYFSSNGAEENFMHYIWMQLVSQHRNLPNFEELSFFYQQVMLSKYSKYFIEYATYFRYRFVNKYSIDYTKSILTTFNKKFDQEKWDKCIDTKYLIQNILFTKICNEFSVDDITTICQLLIKRDQ